MKNLPTRGLLMVALSIVTSAAAQVAFPGAEGFGANVSGGRGGVVYHVNTLSDGNSGTFNAATGVGTGSFRWAVTSTTSSSPRTVVFDVGGMITLNSNLTINRNNVTIAGQTAPGPGITLRGWQTAVSGGSTTPVDNVILRYLRFRPGDMNGTRNFTPPSSGFQGDAFNTRYATNVMIDHISTSWSIDECLSASSCNNVTIQNSLIGEALKDAGHLNDAGTGTELHSMGMLLGSTDATRYFGRISIHHNLFTSNDTRNPRIGNENQIDFVNNVAYNWGGRLGYSGGAAEGTPEMNYVANYLIAGPSTTSGHKDEAFYGGSTNTLIYHTGNLIDGDKDLILDGVNTGTTMFTIAGGTATFMGARFDYPQVTTDSADTAYQRVLAAVGASNVRDVVDARMVSAVRTHTGAIINSQNDVGGYPALTSETRPAGWDTDGDAMPDYWEQARGFNPAVRDHNAVGPNDYTNLENYLNYLTLFAAWNVDGNGNWSPYLNWVGARPEVMDATAIFGPVITAARSVTVDVPTTVGQIAFDSPHGYSLAGSQPLMLDVITGSAQITVLSGAHSVTIPIVLADDAVIDVTSGAGIAVLASFDATGRQLTKTGGGVLELPNVRAAGLSVVGGLVRMPSGSPDGASVLQTLNIQSGAQVDLTNNALIVDYSGASVLGDTVQLLVDGRLTSSSATAVTTIGIVDNSQAGLASFAGQVVDATCLLAKLTVKGDANLDGVVDITDLAALASAWQMSGTWWNGDFNYDGTIDITDLSTLATNWQSTIAGASFSETLSAVGLGGVAVPEPAGLAVLAPFGLCMARRRRNMQHA